MAGVDLTQFQRSLSDLSEKAGKMLRAGQPRTEEPEENTKDQLITPFLEALGYGPEFRRMERHTGEGEVDYVLKRADGQAVCFFEAKHLWERGDLWERHFPQIDRYIRAYWRNYTCRTPEEEVRWVCLGNFRDLYVYHTGDPKWFRHYTLEDYSDEGKVQEIWDLLSRPAMEKGVPDEEWRERHREGIDERFLQHLKIWRLLLGVAFRTRNPHLSLNEIRLTTQQLLQRLVFIRLLERNYLQPPRWLIRFLATYEEFDKPAGRPFAESLRDTIFKAVHLRWNTDLFQESLACDQYDIEPTGVKTVIDGEGYDADFARRAFPGIGQGALFEYYHLYGFDFATLTVDVIGEVYEKFLAHDFEFAPDGSLRIKDSPAVRKREGIYYTPTHIVERIVEQTVGRKTQPIVKQASDLLAAERFDEAYQTISSLSRIRVLDPAMGSGSFLRKVLAHIHAGYTRYNRLVHEAQVKIQEGDGLLGGANGLPQLVAFPGENILRENIYGVDLDPQAIYTASLNLYHQLLELERDRFRQLADQNKARESLPNLKQNLICGNSLSDRPEVAGDNALSLQLAFPFEEDAGLFDVVLGNPPYVRADVMGQTRRKQAKAARQGQDDLPNYVDPDTYLQFRNALEDSGDYETLYEKWDLMIPFIERGMHLLRPGGVYGMIIKEDYCRAKYAERSQDYILREYHVPRIDFYPGINLFPGVGVHNIILYADRDCPKDSKCIRVLHAGKDDEGQVLPQARGRAIFRAEEHGEIGQVPQDALSLREICYISVGFVGHAHEDEHLGEFALEDLISEKEDDTHPKLYVEGKDLGRYVVRRVRYFEWGTSRSPELLRRRTFTEFLDAAPKLIAVRSPGRIQRVVRTNNKLYFNESVVGFVRWDSLEHVMNRSIGKSLKALDPSASSWKAKARLLKSLGKDARKFDLRFLLAILNSSYCTHYLSSVRRSPLHIYPDDYKSLMIPTPSEQRQASITRSVERLEKLSQSEHDFHGIAKRVMRRYEWSPVPLHYYQMDDPKSPVRVVAECDVNLNGWIQKLSLCRDKQRVIISGVVIFGEDEETEISIASVRTHREIVAEFFYILLDAFARGFQPQRPGRRKAPPVFSALADMETCIVYRKGATPLDPNDNCDRIGQVMEDIKHEIGRNDLWNIQTEIAQLDREIDDMVFDLYNVSQEERELVRKTLAASS
jgi:hypothetical protein